MKQFLLQSCLFFIIIAKSSAINNSALSDSTQTRKWSGLLSVANKNVWRGINFGNGAPTIQGMLTFAPTKQFDLNVLGISALTGTNLGYANTLNFFANYKIGGFTVSLDDYYFHGDASNILTNYWDYKNAHFLELRLGYAFRKWEFKGGYTLYGGGFYNNPVIDSSGTVLKKYQRPIPRSQL